MQIQDRQKNDVYIEIKDIVKKYNDNNIAVKNVSLKIKKGEFVTILGPSGCGKTTLLKMLAGFELPTSGRILVNKIDIKDLPIQRKPTATVFQDYALFPHMNVEKNIAYGLKENRVQIEENVKDYSKQCENYFKKCCKKANEKIKTIHKQQRNQLKEIEKLNSQIAKNSLLNEINQLNDDQYREKINKIETQYEQTYQNKLIKNIPLKIKILELINNVFSFLKIDKSIKYQIKLNNQLVYEYLNHQKQHRKKIILNKKIAKWETKYNDADYWLSYWQNYPYEEKEWFENKKITRKLTKKEINAEVEKIIKIVGLENMNKKYPKELSGGMQQRVALARALVIKPDILLLDEPLSALDANVRKQMQQELKRLHKTFNITFILVTHDQEEALTLSQKIVLMQKGEIKQIGTPTEIYNNPKENWVAKFIGKANIFRAQYLDNQIKLFDLVLATNPIYKTQFSYQQIVDVMIRPEHFVITNQQKAKINAKVIGITYQGIVYEIMCEFQKQQFYFKNEQAYEIGEMVWLTWNNHKMHLMPITT